MPSPIPSSTGVRLARAFLGYMAGVALLITLVPFDFTSPQALRLYFGGHPADVLSNILLFMPLGFLAPLSFPRTRSRPFALILGAALFSVALEGAQCFLPSRFPALPDVLANTGGAAIGVWFEHRLGRRMQLTPGIVGALGLELPLMGLVYLLIPLLWLDALAAGGDGRRLVLAGLIGLAGGVILVAVYRHRLGPGGATSGQRFAAVAGLWFLVGGVPAVLRHPARMLALAVVLTLVMVLALGRLKAPAADRRFELRTLHRVFPLLGLYLLLLAGWPPWRRVRPWRFGLAGWESAGTVEILRGLELFAGFTVLGYAVAEMRGRAELRFRQSVWTVLAVALGVAVAVESVAGFRGGADLTRAVGAVLAAIYGGGLYHLQRSRIRALLRPAPASTAEPAVRLAA
jgi:VanZ family protein